MNRSNTKPFQPWMFRKPLGEFSHQPIDSTNRFMKNHVSRISQKTHQLGIDSILQIIPTLFIFVLSMFFPHVPHPTVAVAPHEHVRWGWRAVVSAAAGTTCRRPAGGDGSPTAATIGLQIEHDTSIRRWRHGEFWETIVGRCVLQTWWFFKSCGYPQSSSSY